MKRPLPVAMVLVSLLMGLGLDHGLPHRYVPDETLVTAALGMARDAGELGWARALVPPADRYTVYPYLLAYATLPAVAVTYLGGRVVGAWGGAGAYAEAVFEDAGLAWLPGRLVILLLSLLIPWGVARTARALGRPRGEAALAAILAGSSLLLVQYAHTARPWTATLGLGAMGLAAAVRFAREGRPRDGWVCWLWCGLAAASFQVGLFFVPVAMVGTALALARPPAPRRPWALALGGPLLVAALVAGLGYPHLLLHGSQEGGAEVLEGGAKDASVELGGLAFDLDTLHGLRFQETISSWFGYDPVLILVGFLGLAWLWRGGPRLPVALLVVAPALCFTVLFLLYDGTHVRYLMPAHLFLALGAARALGGLARGGVPARGLALGLLALPLVQAVRFDVLLTREDTRTVAARELLQTIAPHEKAAVDGLGSLYGPPLLPAAASVAELADLARVHPQLWLTRREQRVLALAEAGVPDPPEARRLVPVTRFWRYDSYYPTDALVDGPRELARWMDDHEVDVYVQVDRLPDAERRAPVTAFTAARGELVYELSPTGATDPADASLPTDMSFPLTGLWRWQRPGPWIRAWRLKDVP